MTTRSPWRSRPAAWPALVLLGALLLWGGAARAQDIVLVRDLDFGACDNVGGATYTVAAAASPGVSACFGAQAAQFTVSYAAGDPRRKARIRLTNTAVSITNGTGTLSVSLTDSAGNPGVCLGTGLTVYVGGSVTLPAGGVSTFGLYLGPAQLEATWVGPANCP